VWTAGESIPAGTYTCETVPNGSDTLTVTVVHAGTTAQASNIFGTVVGVCEVTFDVDVVSGGTITGSFTMTSAPTGGADIVVTDGFFDVTDPVN
jgi:hypothetical protein